MTECAMFDLDGTLVNTIDDLANACEYVLGVYGYEKRWSIEDYTSFVGNGAKKLVERAFEHTLSENELNSALELFKKKYGEILLDNAYVYDGVKQSLDAVRAKGVRLAVVTNKPYAAAVKMVESLFGKGYFDFILGATEDNPKKPDPYMPTKALEAVGARGENTVYYGDSDVDVLTARSVGAKAVACSWGFRSRESLENAHPDAIIDTPADIKNFF